MQEQVLGESEEPIAVYLEPASRLSGRVVDEAKHPVAGATVALHGAQEDFTRHGTRPQLRTDPKGGFEAGWLASNSFRLVVTAPGFAVETRDVEVGDGAVETRVEVTLRAEARLSARVRNARGEPIEGAVVSVVEPARLAVAGWVETSDEEGRVELFALAPGPTRLEIRPLGEPPVYQDVVLLPGSKELDLILP